MKITLVGMGMGDRSGLTAAATAALAAADAIIGAGRLVAALPADWPGERVIATRPEAVAASIDASPQWQRVCVALSGDVGFYSGAHRLLDLLHGREVDLLCGVSTPQYLAARLRRPWQDFHLVSGHGRECDPLAEILNHRTVLFLTGGGGDPASLANAFCAAGLDGVAMTVAENLATPAERIVTVTARECQALRFAPLCSVLVDNDRTFRRAVVAPGVEDEAFCRGRAPMTKREVRTLVLSLLQPRPDSVVYDIGAGTGSVAVEVCLLARRGRCFAIERDGAAVALLEQNRERFGVYNLRIVPGEAPSALAGLPPPDAAFIGGSGGQFRAIVEALLAANPSVRLVATAISLDTLATAVATLEALAVPRLEVSQTAVHRTVVRGGHRMLAAMNPVFLLSGGGGDGR